MGSTRILNGDEIKVYVRNYCEEDSIEYNMDTESCIEIITDDEYARVTPNQLLELLLSAGKETRTLCTMRKTVNRLKKKIKQEM